ncbi:MAG: hypothetical protein ABEH65_04080 [Halobacteriales archaeon]
MTLTAVQYGIGPIGGRIVETAVDRGFEFVGAIDIDPAKVGEDLGTVAGLDRELGVTVTDDAEDALAADPDVVFHSTLSSIEAVAPQLEEAMAAGADVVSTTEELAYPWRDNPAVAEEIDATAKDHGTTCLGTGINPGFAMDTLAAVLSTPCQSVETVQVERVQDAGERRKPLQEKVGAGMAVDRWRDEIAAEAGHVGLPESIAMLAGAFGWDLDSVEETIEPVVADERAESEHFTVEPGEAAGIHQVGRGFVDGEAVIELDLKMYLGAGEMLDAVHLRGTPDLDVTVEGGFHGDIATPAVVCNTVPAVQSADPGLATMIDLSTPSYKPIE